MNDAKAYQSHDQTLAQRILEQALREWLDTAAGIALAANGNPPIGDYERGVKQGIEHIRYGHLDNYWYNLVPKIIDQLRRANLLALPELGQQQSQARCFFWDGYECRYEMLFLGCNPCADCPPYDEREDLIHPFVD